VTSFERLQRSQLGAIQQIAAGGQARIHLARDLEIHGEAGPFVFKEFKQKTISINGLDRIAAFRQRLDEFDRQVLDVIANWPMRVVEGPGGTADGLILPLIEDVFFHDIRRPDGTYKRVPRNGEFLTAEKQRCDRFEVQFLGLGDRMRFCRDLVFAVGFMHKRDVCLGDISFANMTYSLALTPSVYLVDCDAFRLKGQAPVVPQLHTPDWTPPEGTKVQSTRTDLYKLGLFILRVLTPRAQGAQNRDPRWASPVLDKRGQVLLHNALDVDPARRTAAKEWYQYFTEILRTRRLPVTPHTSRMPMRPAKLGAAGATP
jgi:hypothetical protein